MAKSRRFSGFLRSLLGQSRSRESRTGENSPLRARSLPSVISKRLRNRVRSFLTRKPSPETAALGIAERQKSEASENSPFMDGGPLQTAKGADVAGQQPPVNPQPEPEPEEQEQQQEQTDDTFDTTLPGGATQTSPGVSPKPSTRTNTGTQEIFDWMNRQFDGDGHRNPVDDTPLPTPSSFNSDSTGPGFDTIEDPGVPLPDHPRTWPIPKPKRRRTSQNPKARVLRESQHDQFAPTLLHRGLFESQHRSIFALKFPPIISTSDEFPLRKRTDSETSVATDFGALSDSTTNRRLSSSSTMTSVASSEALDAQFQRVRTDTFGSNLSGTAKRSNRGGALPSPRRTTLLSESQRIHQWRSSCPPREYIAAPESSQPPMAAFSASITPPQGFSGDSLLKSTSDTVADVDMLSRCQYPDTGYDSKSLVTETTNSSGAEKPRLCLPPEADVDVLSVINEHASDSGSTKLASPRPSGDDRRSMSYDPAGDCGSPDGQGTESQISALASSPPTTLFASRGTSPLESDTSTTSLGDPTEHDQPNQDISDFDETNSDVTDHTDLSLIEAFEASMTPFSPTLLSVLMSIKEDVVDRVTRRIKTIMLQAYGSPQPPAQDAPSSGSPPGNSVRAPLGNPPIPRKRALNDNDPSGGGDGNGEERRKRNNSTSTTLLAENLKKFACPFSKRYPGSENLHKSCRGPGWPSVHRVKEHIYRKHQRQSSPCPRCLVPFDNEGQLAEHTRAEQRCENKTAPPNEEIIYISKTQETELRKKQKGVLEEKRWQDTFRILFPDVAEDQIPSPYHDLFTSGTLPNSEALGQFCTFLERELPNRILPDVYNHLRVHIEVGLQDEIALAVRDTIRETIERVLPGLVRWGRDRVGSEDAGTAADNSAERTPAVATGLPVFPNFPGVGNETRLAPPASAPQPWWPLDSPSNPSNAMYDFGIDGGFPTSSNGLQAENPRTPAIPSSVMQSGWMEDEYLFSLPNTEDYRFSG